jgi:hypothetical protein
LNDAFRTSTDTIGARLALGDLVITRGVAAQGCQFVSRAVEAVRTFADFTPDNDPHGEHDFGAFDLDGKRLNWKVDYFDRAMKWGSPDPADPSVTRRLVTILLAEEY